MSPDKVLMRLLIVAFLPAYIHGYQENLVIFKRMMIDYAKNTHKKTQTNPKLCKLLEMSEYAPRFPESHSNAHPISLEIGAPSIEPVKNTIQR